MEMKIQTQLSIVSPQEPL